MAEVAGYIRRKTMLYVTGVEYGDYTMNHVLGCAHGCLYPCYAFMMKRRFGEVSSYEEWLKPFLVENTLELLDKEIPLLKDKIKSVQLCFTTDPFMYGYPEIADMSIAAIKRLNQDKIKCSVLTKGILPKELATLSKKNEYGITLIANSEEYRKRMEPYSAPYKRRLEALRHLHEQGCKTWVRVEPYPTPNLVNQRLDILLSKIDFVDKIIFGRTNYSKEVNAYSSHKEFYNDAAMQVRKFCRERKIKCHIKEGTITK